MTGNLTTALIQFSGYVYVAYINLVLLYCLWFRLHFGSFIGAWWRFCVFVLGDMLSRLWGLCECSCDLCVVSWGIMGSVLAPGCLPVLR